jgi:putative membrane-bound dehydrogenase-like protein
MHPRRFLPALHLVALPLLHAAEPPAPKDDVKFAGLSPAEAVQAAVVPTGFDLQLFASEPEIVNPIAFCLDDRGRVWVAEGRTYPQRAKEGEGQDRILVFEDTDGDGKADKRTVFMEHLNLVSGLEIGFGGLWVGAAPYLMFIPIADGDAPKPAGEPKILLDGWGYQDTHETLNTFRWGPDGWLYGCHGVFTHSNVGKPGASDAERTKINAGFWRYQPVRHEFEVFAHGTSNSWGIDFDKHGQLFAEACVIPHLFHIAQGGRYQRQAGEHFNKFTFADIPTIADHRHYVGANPHGGNGRSDSTGGGHAHAGFVVPQAGGAFGEWEGRLLMGNIHGQRINGDIAEPKGSGFIGKHGPDFINFNDRASQIVDLRQGPGASIFMIDWYDLNQCHNPKREIHDYTTGRIYKLVRKVPGPTQVNLAAESDAALSKHVTEQDEWLSRHARRLLQERAAKAQVKFDVPNATDQAGALRILWTQHLTGNLSAESLQRALGSPSEYVRAWAVQLSVEKREVSPTVLAEFERLAKGDPSAVVRRYLASAAQRLPREQRLPILAPLVTHAEDATDPNLPLLLWYALEPVVAADPAAAADLLGKTKIPQLQEFIARRMAATAQVD